MQCCCSIFSSPACKRGIFPNRKKKLPSYLTIHQTVTPNCFCTFTMSLAVDTVQDKQVSPRGSFNPFPSPQQRTLLLLNILGAAPLSGNWWASTSASLAHFIVHSTDVPKNGQGVEGGGRRCQVQVFKSNCSRKELIRALWGKPSNDLSSGKRWLALPRSES